MAEPKETARKTAGLADKMAQTVEHAVHEAAGQLLDAGGNALKQGTQAAQLGADSAARFAQQQQGRGAALAGDMAERGRAGVAGALESGSAMAQGMQQVLQLWSEFAQESWRRQIDTTQQLLNCRSVEDVVRIQSEFVRESLEDFAQRSRRLTKLSAEITSDTMGRAGAVQRMAAE